LRMLQRRHIGYLRDTRQFARAGASLPHSKARFRQLPYLLQLQLSRSARRHNFDSDKCGELVLVADSNVKFIPLTPRDGAEVAFPGGL